MKGDFSKLSFNPKKHYSGVRMQQGRVLLDTDWNEQADIYTHQLTQTGQDFIGQAGAPAENPGFAVTTSENQHNLIIGSGRYYVDGIFCEKETAMFYTAQPDFPTELPTQDGYYLAYLEVWQDRKSVV